MFDLTLTFDNGPEPETTPFVLDVLARRSIRTTFFVVGHKLSTPEGRELARHAYRAEAVQRARQLAPVLAEMKSAGLSARQMAAELTLRGIQTPTGARWHAQTVLRMIDRAGC